VELLVVIGIIAVLISILLPSLRTAREAATTVACSSNIRQVGLGLQMYCQNNKGRAPWNSTLSTDNTPWQRVISISMGTKPPQGQEYPYVSPAFQCPAVMPLSSTPRAHYQGTSRLFSERAFLTTAPTGKIPPWTVVPNTYLAPPANFASLSKPSETGVAWDAPLYRVYNVNDYEAQGADIYQDDYRATSARTYGNQVRGSSQGDGVASIHVFPGGFATTTITPAMVAPYNYDPGPTNFFFDAVSTNVRRSPFRFRHKKDTTLNMLFADGHVEARRYDQLYERDLQAKARVPADP